MKRLWILIAASYPGPLLAMLAAGCLMATVAGCARGGKPAGGNEAADSAAVDAPVKPEFRYKVVAETTDFFHISPQQAAGADEKLKKETRITLVKRYGGFSQIKTPGGITGYVASDEIARISVQEAAAEDAAEAARLAPPPSLAPMLPGPGGTYSIPPEATRDTVLPVPDASPAAKPTPNSMFRY